MSQPEIEKGLKRITIHVKDLQVITGRSNTWCRERIKEIKEKQGLSKQELVTIKQACEFFKWNEQEIQKYIR